MSMYDQYVGKQIKVVWSDFDRQKAIVGVLKEFSDGFLTVEAIRDGNLISILASSVVTISEYKGVKE